MNKNEFLSELRIRLGTLPPDERDAALRFYEEYFNEAENEQSAIEELGSPAKIAESIQREFAQTGQPYYYNYAQGSANAQQGYSVQASAAAQKTKTGAPWWVVIPLAVLAFPLLFALLGVLFGLIATVIGLLVALVAVLASLLLAGIAIVIAGFITVFHQPLNGALLLGIGFIVTGLGLLLLVAGGTLCVKVVPKLVRWIVELCKKIFRKRGAQV